VLRSTGLNLSRQHDPRYGFRLGLGVLALAGAIYLGRFKRPKPESAQQRQGLIARLTAMPTARTAFAAGVLIFAPSATFIAAVQVPATAQAAVPVTALTLVIIILLTCMVVWLPLIAYLAAPDATTRLLKTINDAIRLHAKRLGLYALALCGAILIVNGALGVAGVI
jgi:hypothetical protein